jgi:hypothetical protein
MGLVQSLLTKVNEVNQGAGELLELLLRVGYTYISSVAFVLDLFLCSCLFGLTIL